MMAHQNVSKLLVKLLHEGFVEAFIAPHTHIVAPDTAKPVNPTAAAKPSTTVTDDEEDGDDATHHAVPTVVRTELTPSLCLCGRLPLVFWFIIFGETDRLTICHGCRSSS